MARSSKNTQQVNVTEDSSLDRVVAVEVSKLLGIAPPWLLGLVAVIVATVFHHLWAGNVWASVGMVPPALMLSALAWLLAHQRGSLGRVHVTATPAVVGVWLAFATANGPLNGRAMAYATLIGGGTLCLSWNLRTALRRHGDGRGHDTLSTLFGVEQAETVGLPGARLHTLKTTAHKLLAKLVLPAGSKVADDAQRRRPYVESVLALPPGSVTVTPDEDRADHVDITIVDPRRMKNPIPWPGPSKPGKSIADPLRIGVYADGDEAAYTLLEHHLLMMGMSGAGKSFGGTWNLVAEAITRRDTVIWATDITKKSQTLGAVAPALDWMATTKQDALSMLDTVRAVIGPRTEHLSQRRLNGWRPGCGLQFLIVILEEASDVFAAMSDKQQERFVSTMRSARSAGIYLVASLQRAIWDQIDTNARAQFAGAMCFGVQSDKDAAFGLPDLALDAGARPELWQANRPGCCYLAAPGITDGKVAVPIRTYRIDDEVMRRHTAAHPAETRRLDDVTVRAAGDAYTNRHTTAGDAEPADGHDEDMSAVDEYQKTPDPDPTVTGAMDDPIDDPPDDEEFTFKRPSGEKLPADEARRAVIDQIAAWADEGRDHFATRDLRQVWETTGRSRSWIIGQIKELIAAGVIEDADEGGYVITRAPARA